MPQRCQAVKGKLWGSACFALLPRLPMRCSTQHPHPFAHHTPPAHPPELASFCVPARTHIHPPQREAPSSLAPPPPPQACKRLGWGMLGCTLGRGGGTCTHTGTLHQPGHDCPSPRGWLPFRTVGFGCKQWRVGQAAKQGRGRGHAARPDPAPAHRPG